MHIMLVADLKWPLHFLHSGLQNSYVQQMCKKNLINPLRLRGDPDRLYCLSEAGADSRGFRAIVKASYETRRPDESIGTNHVMLACREGG